MAVRVEVYESVIAAHFSPGGIVYRNGSGLGRRASSTARLFAPRRSGELKASITAGIRPNYPSRYHQMVNLKASAPHAPYVEHGTDGPITPRRAPYMPIPAYGRFAAFRATSVNGQRAQHFLQRGMNRALNSLGYGNIPGEF